MTIYEIVNPSDAYTLESDNFEAACCAVVFLGEGHYGLKEVGGEATMPLFIFSGAALEAANAWWQETFGRTYEAYLTTSDKSAVADVLDTVLIGGATSRETYRKGLELIDDPDKRTQWRDHWHDQRRTSMNNIGNRAWAIAENLRRSAS